MIKKIMALTTGVVIFLVSTLAQADYTKQLSKYTTFCGEAVALKQPEIFRSVDQNLVLLAEAKSRIWMTLRRSTRFLPIIEKELKRASVPDDFKYFAQTISSMNPKYNSPQGRGLWRLSKENAQDLGLRIDKFVDERLDPTASTVAAAKHFKALKAATGSWTTAMAAHLLGEKVISQAVTEAGGEANFYKIYLPNGLDQLPTMVLAGKIIFSSPGDFGYNLEANQGWPVLSTRRETVPQATTAQALATKYKLDYKTFRDMNPHLLSNSIPAGVTLNVI